MTNITIIGLAIATAIGMFIASRAYAKNNEQSQPFLFAMGGAILLITGFAMLSSPLQTPNGYVEEVVGNTTTVTPTYTTNTFINAPIAITLILVSMFSLVDAIPRIKFKKQEEDRLEFD